VATDFVVARRLLDRRGNGNHIVTCGLVREIELGCDDDHVGAT
jgi:hypothetical protein